MRNPIQSKRLSKKLLLILPGVIFLMTLGSIYGQTLDAEPTAQDPVVNTGELVSIQVDGGTIRQVLNAFAMQTKRNVVIGPEVTNDVVTIHLTDVQWDNALDVILKPYGYGYRVVGNAIVVGELTRLKALETVEPLQSRVYELSYLDAGDAREIIEAQLSPRGRMSIITARGQKGWDFGSAQRRATSRSGSTLEKRVRMDNDQAKSKTIVINDVPSVLDRVAETLEKIDKMPQQVLVEARFLEVNEDLLRDIGMQMGGSFEIDGNPIGIAEQFFEAEPNSFGQLSEDVTGKMPLTTFGQITADGGNWNLLISLLQEDEDTKTLSAPKILTLNNQEATIIVGRKFPIIESDVSGGGNTDSVTVSLDYYENIGIQLNVVPQICDDKYINMIVHPSVSSIESFVSAGVGSVGATNNVPLAEYPIIKVRDAETQILVANGETIVIGGLLEERETDGVFKVPFLGDIPVLGHLFRRDTKDNSTIDLLIFLTATIIDSENYDDILEKNHGMQPIVVEPIVVEPIIVAEPIVVEPIVIKPEPIVVEPEPATVDPEAMEPEPSAMGPEPAAMDPEPVAMEPEPVAMEPEPVAMDPKPVAMEPEESIDMSVAEIMEKLM
ncbi:MAG: secretin and TonB N-terminal domain-containing protein [Kiritimatiellales bacterium]|nr:secretin and TonB N-terminal domain-containing protein [Kiritimatiellota bacterium]MBL7015924.1 secretin and TonB N-terminal domain-containing protein [Kiritimatiellales bacterium]